ncbi:MAG TPA: DUF1127 domain-containing protein [Roseomonas sp.]|jgi:uncharacterized protein YjiS (DUF1127 family)
MSASVVSFPLAARRSRGVVRAFVAATAEALHAITTRRQLLEMDERMLKDIGISRTEALREAARVPWDNGTSRPR